MTMDWFFRSSHDDRIRYMGWTLLLMWMLSITYMTRDFWFPSAYGLPSLMESDRKRRERARNERRKGKEKEDSDSFRSLSSSYYST
ncbi:hypothetical protein PRIPAC_78601 [Pristionchus pacificus]|uniref:Uncharacterized protein n=1 Tax=Pristionchus pacificus TaxID=54126 RepID=A0A2A6C2I6_PRIPA|nr:hypothetical protein PRIPAC_78601 [Pristionchus pacificus]|eukprot:PDM72318.1 hypothetical protein PRIPAC_38752 [Pristionchus pacificus]